MDFMVTGMYNPSWIILSQGISIGATCFLMNSTSGRVFGASRSRPIMLTLGMCNAWLRRAVEPFGRVTRRIAGSDGVLMDAIASSCGRCECNMGGYSDRSTKTATKGVSSSSQAFDATRFEMPIGVARCAAASRRRSVALKPTKMEAAISGG